MYLLTLERKLWRFEERQGFQSRFLTLPGSRVRFWLLLFSVYWAYFILYELLRTENNSVLSMVFHSFRWILENSCQLKKKKSASSLTKKKKSVAVAPIWINTLTAKFSEQLEHTCEKLWIQKTYKFAHIAWFHKLQQRSIPFSIVTFSTYVLNFVANCPNSGHSRMLEYKGNNYVVYISFRNSCSS